MDMLTVFSDFRNFLDRMDYDDIMSYLDELRDDAVITPAEYHFFYTIWSRYKLNSRSGFNTMKYFVQTTGMLSIDTIITVTLKGL